MHLYVHVPFCARRCTYCDFSIAVRRSVPSSEYVTLLLAEWDRERRAEPWRSAGAIETVYFGGGTPSRLAPSELTRLLGSIATTATVVPGAEITLEANPDDVTAAAALSWRQAGITRVSLGAQSFSMAVLTWMHRTHSAEQIGRAVDSLRRAGIENISLDLIFALPPALARDWDADLRQALTLEPAHLSLYGLTVEPHTALGRWTARGTAIPATDQAYALEYLAAVEAFARAGLSHYEVSNAARPGFASRHNQAYWQRHPYLGLGPSAHSAAGPMRRWNIRDWAAWQRAMRRGLTTVDAQELLNEDQDLMERRYLALRTRTGAALSLVPESSRSLWQRHGWATVADDHVRLTPEGWLRLDALVAGL